MDNERDTLEEIDELITTAKQRKKSTPKTEKNSNREVNVTYPQKTFLDFADNTKKENMVELLFAGGVGSGKSYAICLQLLKYVQYPNTTVLLLHLHLATLKKTTLPLLIQGTVSPEGVFLPPLLPPECIQSFNKSDGIIYLTNGSKIILSGVQDSEKLKSINCSAAFIDELTHLRRDDYFSILQRCRVYSDLPNGVYSATNPATNTHWCYKHFSDNALPKYREMITVDSRSNLKNLPKAYVKSLEGLPELERLKMLEGKWISLGKEVFYTFDISRHVKDLNAWKKEEYDDFILCNDLGGGAKFSGTALIGRKDGIYYILEEYSKKKSTHKEILDWLEQYRSLTELVAYDPANAVFLTDLENASWKALKPNKDIEQGVSKICSMFAEDRIIISTKCPVAIKQFMDAQRDPDTNKWNKATEEIDMLDAIRYGLICLDNNALIEKNLDKSGGVFVFSL
jgi:PBSX family phage terminase large subunit